MPTMTYFVVLSLQPSSTSLKSAYAFMVMVLALINPLITGEASEAPEAAGETVFAVNVTKPSESLDRQFILASSHEQTELSARTESVGLANARCEPVLQLTDQGAEDSRERQAFSAFMDLHFGTQRHVISYTKYMSPYTYIAHAGGAIQSDKMTNAREAIEHSLALGFLQVEIDLLKTADGVLVGAHDWESWAQGSGFTGALPPTHRDFMSLKIDGKYSPVDATYLRSLLARNPNLTLVTDKVNSPEMVAAQIVHVRQIVMELFSASAIEAGVGLGFKDLLASDSVLEEFQFSADAMRRSGVLGMVGGFTVSRHMVTSCPSLFLGFKETGYKVYVFYVNDSDYRGTEAQVLCDLDKLITGLYVESKPSVEDVVKAGCRLP
jgi:hypothetical protein